MPRDAQNHSLYPQKTAFQSALGCYAERCFSRSDALLPDSEFQSALGCYAERCEYVDAWLLDGDEFQSALGCYAERCMQLRNNGNAISCFNPLSAVMPRDATGPPVARLPPKFQSALGCYAERCSADVEIRIGFEDVSIRSRLLCREMPIGF